MAYLTALLPVAQAVASHAALTAAADTAHAAGDERGKGQVMADTLVACVTGQQAADAVPVEVHLVMTDRTLLAGDDTPAQLLGYGTVPAAFARAQLTPSHEARGEVDEKARVWLRRLFTHPTTGALVAMDSTRRTFDGGLRRYVLLRDAGTCRTPWCDAPAQHVDHVRDHADGGPTSDTNAQGLCVQCNHAKQHPGFTAITVTGPAGPGSPPGAPHTVVTATPTGHAYTSHAPPLIPGLLRDQREPERARVATEPDQPSRLERVLALALVA